jgi:NAD(P)-dependent dehydrogenase (short-subunit alcohol dehydrogenase family)
VLRLFGGVGKDKSLRFGFHQRYCSVMANHEHRIAIVTGANKGIGFEVVRQLARQHFHVFLSARNAKAGEEAARKLKADGEVIFLQMDVSDAESIARAVKEFSNHASHLDVLVNNAGIILDGDDNVLKISAEMLETTLRTNSLGPLLVSQAFVPLLAKSRAPRIVNVSSGSGQLSDGADGWAPAYSISKTALNGVTVQLAAALPKFSVNAVCPGWVRTEMGGSNATRSVAEGAYGIVWLAADAPPTETGKFWRDRKVISW